MKQVLSTILFFVGSIGFAAENKNVSCEPLLLNPSQRLAQLNKILYGTRKLHATQSSDGDQLIALTQNDNSITNNSPTVELVQIQYKKKAPTIHRQTLEPKADILLLTPTSANAQPSQIGQALDPLSFKQYIAGEKDIKLAVPNDAQFLNVAEDGSLAFEHSAGVVLVDPAGRNTFIKSHPSTLFVHTAMDDSLVITASSIDFQKSYDKLSQPETPETLNIQTIRTFSHNTGEEIIFKNLHNFNWAQIESMQVSPDGTVLYVTGQTKKLTGKRAPRRVFGFSLSNPEKPATEYQVSHDCVLTSYDGSLNVRWNRAPGYRPSISLEKVTNNNLAEIAYTQFPKGSTIRPLAFSTNNRYLVLIQNEESKPSLEIFDIDTQKIIATYPLLPHRKHKYHAAMLVIEKNKYAIYAHSQAAETPTIYELDVTSIK